jgi:oligoendopeptidase F
LEGLLADAGEIAEAPGNIFSMFNNADIKFPKIKDENGRQSGLPTEDTASFWKAPTAE